jgi:hypothetical protein
MNNRARGGILAVVGYILSPFSWWNDLIINLPLSYALAFPFGLISQKFFVPAVITIYWGTNILGLMLIHHGAKNMASAEIVSSTKKELFKDLVISLVYTLGIVILVYIGWLKFPLDYFS